MRGCLISLAILLILGFLLIWVALPAVAGVLAINALRASGMTGSDLSVVVSANPPFELLAGQADTVRLQGDDVSIHDLTANRVDVTLGGVSLFSQDVHAVHGTFSGVLLATPDGDSVTVEEVDVEGAADAASAALQLSAAEAQSLAKSRLLAEVGLSGTVTFTAPDRVRIAAAGQAVTGRLVVTSGALVLRPDTAVIPAVTLIDPRQGNPFELTSVGVTPTGGVRLTGRVDVAALLQGKSALP